VALLMPACLLVMLVLASIAVDMSLVHLRQRQAVNVAAAAANDAVTAGASPDAIRRGDYALDRHRVERVVQQVVEASDLAPYLAGPPEISIDGTRVAVTVTVEVDYLFTAVMPAAPDSTVVRGSASATPAPGITE
jgi:Flp pilus assembly protein TadG